MATNTGEVSNIQPPPQVSGDVSNIQPPAPARSALGEVGTGFARGALADLPTMAGQALQFAGANNVGGAVRGFGETMGNQSWLTMQPESHGAVTNFLAQGAEQVAPVLAPAVIAGAAVTPLGLPALATVGVGAAAGGALAAGQAGQTTLEAAQAKGLSPESAQAASRLNAASTFATQVGLGMVGGKVLGVAGNALGKAVGAEAAPLANQVLDQLTGQGGWLKAGLKQGAIGAAEASGIGAVQAGSSAAINNAYGIDDQNPLAAAAEAIPQMLSLSAMLTPLGLASRALQVRSAAARTETLASEKTDPALRQQLADQYAAALPTSVAQQNFAANAKIAIDNGHPLKVDTGLFDQGAVQPPETPAALTPAAPTPLLANNPSPNIVFPDGTVARNQKEVDDYITGLPENEQAAARAKLFGLGAQPAGAEAPAPTPLLANNPSPITMGQGSGSQRGYTFPDGSSTNDIGAVQSYLDGLPTEQRAAARAKIFGFEQQANTYDSAEAPRAAAVDISRNLVPQAGVSAMDAINSITGVDRAGLSKQELAKRKADASAAFKAPSGVRVSGQDGVERELTAGELYDMRNAVNQAEQPQADGTPALLPPPTPRIGEPGQTGYNFPDGSSTNDFTQVQSYLDGLPAADRPAARAKIFGFEPQANAYDAAEMPRDVAVSSMRDAVNTPTPGVSALDMINGITGADRSGLSKSERTAREADAKAALNEPSGVRVSDSQTGIERELTMGEVYDLRNQKVEAAASAPAPGSAKTGDAITADINAANKTITGDETIKKQALVPLQKQLDALGIDRLGTHQEQIDALAARLSDENAPKLGQATRDRMQALLDKWKGETPQEPAAEQALPVSPSEPATAVQPLPEAPASADTLPENIPASVETQAPAATNAALPENIPASVQAQSPGNDAALPDNLTQSPRSHAQDTAVTVDATLKNFDARIQGGEKLSPLEQERYEDLQAMQHQLADVISGKTNNAAFAQSISDLAREAATKPYTESYRREKREGFETTSPKLMLDAMRTGRLTDTLDTIAQNGSSDEVKRLAARIGRLVNGATIQYTAKPVEGRIADGFTAIGNYQPVTNHISIYPGGESEATILHEAVHSALLNVMRTLGNVPMRDQAHAQAFQALGEIHRVMEAARKAKDADQQYGLTNADEFVAELNANPQFRDFLKAQGTGKNLFSRAIDAFRRMLGLKVDDRSMLQRAIEANEGIFKYAEQNNAGFPLQPGTPSEALFRKSPTDAVKVTDEQGSKLAGLADRFGDKINISALDQKAYRALAAWKTVQYLADRIRAVPEMVQSGFAKGLDAYQQAHESKRIANMFVTKPVSAYADRVQKMLNGLGDADKSRDLSRQMATIGGEASRGGFDYRMNYAANAAAGRDIPAHNKAYVDDIHRQYTQLQRTNPEAAKALVDGQLLNHKTLVNVTSTLARNLMEIASGSYTKLAADLTRMAPDDAARAAAEARVKGALPSHEMARAHAGKLDIMGRDLETARNTKPDTFADGSTQALDARLNAMFADARKLPEGSTLRGNLNELEQMYRAQSQNPYFALGRSGDFFVKAGLKGVDEATQKKIQDALKGSNKVVGNLVSNDGNVFFRVDSQDQAVGLYNKLRAAAGDKLAEGSGAWGKLAHNDPSFVQGTSPALRQMLNDLHSTVENSGIKGEAADTMRETLTRSLLSLLPETSSRSAKMNRQGIPGYDADFLGTYSRRAMGSVRDMASIYTQRAFDDSFNQMSTSVDQMNRTGSADGRVRAQDTLDEITKRYANDRKPIDNTTINTINSLGHAFYLAISPAYLIRTTAQPFHRALPLLGSRYGFVNSAKEIGGATGAAMKIVANTVKQGWQADGARGVLAAGMAFREAGLSKSEETFVQELHDRGILNLGQTHQLQQMALGGTQRQQDLQRMASMTAQYAEMTNRLATGLAAFRLAEKGSKNISQAGREANTEYAIQAIDRAMDNFDPSNTARAIGKHGFAGRVTPLLTAFMNYNLQTMQQIARTVHDGMFNQDKSAAGLQRASEARKEFSGLMATTMMISGAMGLPFANVFAGLWNTYKDVTDPNNPGDIRIDAQNFLAKTFGHTAGDVISHGVPRLANFDSSTFGLENLMPGSEFLASRQLLKDRLADQSQALMGPALNAGVGIVEAMHQMYSGYWAKGIEAALPSGLKPYFKAAELATRGYTDSKENPIPLKANGWDVGLQAAGFHTGARATELESQQFKSARGDQLNFRKDLIQDRFYKAVTTKDPAALEDAKQDMQSYNASNPFDPIRNVQSGITSRLQQLAVGNALGIGFAATPAQLPVLMKQLAFARDAAMPGE